jgi:hypothetical protein
MRSRTPSHEAILQHFQARRGLYILGAGASTGLVPFASEFLRTPAIDYVHGGGFPVETPHQSELTRKSIGALLSGDAEDISSLLFPGRIRRPGTAEFPYEEMLRRQPDFLYKAESGVCPPDAEISATSK